MSRRESEKRREIELTGTIGCITHGRQTRKGKREEKARGSVEMDRRTAKNGCLSDCLSI